MGKKFTKNDLINLYAIIKDFKANGLDRDSRKSYITLKIKLREMDEDFTKKRDILSEETKPTLEFVKKHFKDNKIKGVKIDEIKEGDDNFIQVWNDEYSPIMMEWLSEEVEIDLNIFDIDAFTDFCMANEDMNPNVETLLGKYLVKMDE